VTRTPLSRSKAGHQAALLTAVLARNKAAAAVAWERVGSGKLLLRCRLLSGARRFGDHGGGEGRRHIVATACLQLAHYLVRI